MLQKLHDIIIYWDYTIWYYLNAVWHNAVLDAIIPYLRNQWTWAPLYLFLAIFMPLNFGRKGFMWCVFFLLTFALSDYTSASIIKQHFHRLRPCNNIYLTHIVHLLVPCGSGYSFPSSHAANHFGLAVFASISLSSRFKWIWYAGLTWAALVAYAQVYVGVHFPLDVLCGGMMGCLAGFITGKVYNRIYYLGTSVPAEIV